MIPRCIHCISHNPAFLDSITAGKVESVPIAMGIYSPRLIFLKLNYELIKLVKKSPRRDAMLQNVKEQMSENSPGIRVLCPTRWTVRDQALQSITANYEALQMLWEESLDVVKDTEMRSCIQGVSSLIFSLEYHWESYCLNTVTI